MEAVALSYKYSYNLTSYHTRLFSDGKPASIRNVRPGYRVRRRQKGGRRRPRARHTNTGESGIE